MRRVPRDERPSLAVVVHHAAVDPEVRQPDGVGEAQPDVVARAFGDQAPEQLQRGLGHLARRIRVDDRDQSAQPEFRERERSDHPLFVEPRDRGVERQVPVHLHVAQHEVFGVGLPLEGKAEGLAHEAVRAVATDQVSGPDLLRRAGLHVVYRGDHGIGLLAERDQLARTLHPAAQNAEPIPHHAFDLCLVEDDHPAVGLVRARAAVQAELDSRYHPLALQKGDPVDGCPLRDDGVDNAHVVEHLQRPGLQAQGARRDRKLGVLVDQATPDTAPAQLTGQRQPDRAGPHDQYVRITTCSIVHARLRLSRTPRVRHPRAPLKVRPSRVSRLPARPAQERLLRAPGSRPPLAVGTGEDE